MGEDVRHVLAEVISRLATVLETLHAPGPSQVWLRCADDLQEVVARVDAAASAVQSGDLETSSLIAWKGELAIVAVTVRAARRSLIGALSPRGAVTLVVVLDAELVGDVLDRARARVEDALVWTRGLLVEVAHG